MLIQIGGKQSTQTMYFHRKNNCLSSVFLSNIECFILTVLTVLVLFIFHLSVLCQVTTETLLRKVCIRFEASYPIVVVCSANCLTL